MYLQSNELLNEIQIIINQISEATNGVVVFEEYIAKNLTVPYEFAPATCNRQRAASVAALARELYEQGVVETAAEHKPDYLRLSQAERELAERNLGDGKDFTI